MKDREMNEFYFGNSKDGELFYCNGDLKCRLRCLEWSDGRLACRKEFVSVVQKSQKTGKFIWYTDYVKECAEFGKETDCRSYSLQELKEAYWQLLEGNECNSEYCVRLSMEIVRAFNDEYSRSPGKKRIAPSDDILLFIKSILYVLENGDGLVPASIRAELCREAGLFDKCLEFDAAASRSVDEREIIAEIQFRAAHGDSRPFIIEHCEYYTRNLRPVKRYPCPMLFRYDNC